MAPTASQLAALLLAFWAFVRLGIASPLATHNASALERRQCIWNDAVDDWHCDLFMCVAPQTRVGAILTQFVKRMHDAQNDGKATPENRAIFYANLFEPPASKEVLWEMWNMILGWMKSRGITAYYGSLYALDKDWKHAQVDWMNDHSGLFGSDYVSFDKAQKLYDYCYSQALAIAALHPEGYIFTKHDEPWKSDSTWEQAEYWPLTREGGPVERIYRIDPRPEEKGGTPCAEPALIWERGKNPPIEPKWRCPITEDNEPNW